jgi:ABC-2 type transport system ATP-binding protein
MARRIGLAQALINDPDLILLDEPTTGLDPIGTREMKDLILSLKQQGKTVLLCSHLLADVQDVCDRITILFRGRMQTLGQVRTWCR